MRAAPPSSHCRGAVGRPVAIRRCCGPTGTAGVTPARCALRGREFGAAARGSVPLRAGGQRRQWESAALWTPSPLGKGAVQGSGAASRCFWHRRRKAPGGGTNRWAAGLGGGLPGSVRGCGAGLRAGGGGGVGPNRGCGAAQLSSGPLPWVGALRAPAAPRRLSACGQRGSIPGYPQRPRGRAGGRSSGGGRGGGRSSQRSAAPRCRPGGSGAVNRPSVRPPHAET